MDSSSATPVTPGAPPSPSRPPKGSPRDRIRARRDQERRRSTLVWALLGLGALGFFGFLLFSAIRPQQGEDVAVLPNTPHIPFPTPPGPYNTNPPTSGLHYAGTLPAGFYDEAQAAAVGEFPEGYLVHNLEHDYTIFWYNCTSLAAVACADMKDEIRAVMDGVDNFKVIAFPWPSQPQPIVLTHWAMILRMQEFDAGAARAFISSNRGRSPEPNAP